MDALVVADMQCGLLAGAPTHDLRGVVGRINRLADMVRRRAGKVIWIRHCGEDDFAPGKPGWEFARMDCHRDDVVVDKSLNDAFAGTELKATVRSHRVLISGWATGFCVDATVRSAVSNGYDVIAAADAHTLADRPHLDERAVIRHHNWGWSEPIMHHSIVLPPRTNCSGKPGPAHEFLQHHSVRLNNHSVPRFRGLT